MPAATTHVEFAKDVYRLLSAEDQNKITNRQMFLLGSQGPDLLFFSRLSLLPGSLKKYGDEMHRVNVYPVIQFFTEYSKDDTDLQSYLYGYLCHYSLDSNVHPLVNAYAWNEAAATNGNPGQIHVRIEAEYDRWILHQRGRLTSSYNVYESLKISSACRKKLGEMYYQMFREVFGYEVSKQALKDAPKEIVMGTKILTPGNPSKYRMFYEVENVLKMPHSFTGMMLDEKTGTDALNIERKPYANPECEDGVDHASFPLLYGRAITKAMELWHGYTEADFPLNFNGDPVDHPERH